MDLRVEGGISHGRSTSGRKMGLRRRMLQRLRVGLWKKKRLTKCLWMLERKPLSALNVWKDLNLFIQRGRKRNNGSLFMLSKWVIRFIILNAANMQSEDIRKVVNITKD